MNPNGTDSGSLADMYGHGSHGQGWPSHLEAAPTPQRRNTPSVATPAALCVGLALLLVVATLEHGAEAALLGRDLDSNGGNGFEAYYDDVFDITWQTNANLAATNAFGIERIGMNPPTGTFGITPSGEMTWNTASAWLAAMNATHYLGFSDWRLPTLTPVDGTTTFNTTFSNNGTTDFGYSIPGIGWGDHSEMGWMYYGNLGNLGFCTANGGGTSSTCVPQPGAGIVNTGPFAELQQDAYWALWDSGPFTAWSFHFNVGAQLDNQGKSNFVHVWAVRDGDVAVVPIPGALGLLGAALVVLAHLVGRPCIARSGPPVA